MTYHHIVFQPFGERGLEMVWPEQIAIDLLLEIRSITEALSYSEELPITDIVPSYARLLLVFNGAVKFKVVVEKLQQIINEVETKQLLQRYRWLIPVCYEAKYGLDIDQICETSGLSPEELISLHTGVDYPIYFFGFLPGFVYLGGLNERLHFPRKDTPRKIVRKGSVGIANSQTGIYPQDSPGGWQLIGRTPIALFNVKSTPPVLAKPGDLIRFFPINDQEFKHIESISDHYKIGKEEVD